MEVLGNKKLSSPDSLWSFSLVQFKKQKLLIDLDKYAPDVAELIRTPMEMHYIPLKVALV